MYQEQQAHVISLFKKTNVRQVNFSFDLWKGPNHRYYLGIVAHWFDVTPTVNKVRHVLLALRNLTGPYSGENQGVLLWKIIQNFELTELIGWFTLDSGAYNGITLRWLSEKVEQEIGWWFDYKERYIRCFGHTLNLVVEAFLIGAHYSNLKRALNDIKQE
ncbi:MAG: hypothetical protein ACE3JU_25390 [Paenibacillus sp.]|uniref:hypothetical protein n=1 Tax=Paenibacillus sp. TaxID=58172 RepID=UPI003B813230